MLLENPCAAANDDDDSKINAFTHIICDTQKAFYFEREFNQIALNFVDLHINNRNIKHSN